MELSVIICTHNPRADYLRRVLDALEAQTLARDRWELLLVDNASKEPLAASWDLSWHPHARHVRENELGLTPARLRGINESKSEILVFVDDDNVLAGNYLEQVLRISLEFPKIGVWGGSITGVYEADPPGFAKQYLGLLAVGEVTSDAWGTLKGFNAACPPGAGMAVRKMVALVYLEQAQNDPIRLVLGRKGGQLTCGEDIDLAWSACSMGYGMGRFKDLRLQHLIGAQRLSVDYFERLIEGGCYSNVFLFHVHDMPLAGPPETIWARLRFIKQQIAMPKIERRLAKAGSRGVMRGLAELRNTCLKAPRREG